MPTRRSWRPRSGNRAKPPRAACARGRWNGCGCWSRAQQTARARALLNSIPEKSRKNLQNELIPLEMQIAAQSNSVPALLARYARGLANRRRIEPLGTAPSELRRVGQDAAARRVLEFIYTRELEAHHFDSSNFLGLAEIRLEREAGARRDRIAEADDPGIAEPFETLAPAAALLCAFRSDCRGRRLLRTTSQGRAVGRASARATARHLAGTRRIWRRSRSTRARALCGPRRCGGGASANGGAALTTGVGGTRPARGITPFDRAGGQ